MSKDLFISYRYIIIRNIEAAPLPHSHHAIQLQYNVTKKSITKCDDHTHKGHINIVDSDKSHTAIQNRETITILISPESFEGRAIRKFIDYSSCYTIDNVKPCVKTIFERIYSSDFKIDSTIKLLNELVFHLVGGDIRNLQDIDSRIESVLESMSNAELESLTLQKLSSETFLSESRFQHLFKDNTGVSLSKYLLWYKTIKAVKWILKGASITDAALNSGFSDSAHFTRTFKKNVGITPKSLKGFQ